MKILLLNPPRRDNVLMVKEGRCMQRKGAWGYMMSPVTMVTIATLLTDIGHDVTVLDCPAEAIDFPSMLDMVNRMSPGIVYINTSTPTIDDDILTAWSLKKQSPPPVTAVYGIHPSCLYRDILRHDSGVDYCVVGEPELTARDLTMTIERGGDPSLVPGLAFLDASHRLVVTPGREPLVDLDELPVPDWSFIDTGNYRLPLNNERFLLVNTNRGCPYRCTFCNAYVYYGRAPRRRSVGHIMQELSRDVERHGVTNFMFWAEEFILDRKFVIDLCDAIVSSGMAIKWVCNSRVDAVDVEVLNAIRRAGCWNIAFGIESGVQDILTRINKQVTLAQTSHAVKIAKNAGLQVTGHVIIGFPEDTSDTIATTERFVNSLDLDFVQYYCAMPYPGTDLYRDAVTNQWLTTKNWKRWEHNSSILRYDHLTAAEIMRYRRRMMLRWYFTPDRITKTLKNHIKRPADIWALLSRLAGFIRWM